MAVTKLNASDALDLSIELLADLELERIPLSSCIMKAARLARLNGDEEHLSIFQFELSGYPHSPNGVSSDVWRLCKAAGRVRKVRPKGKDGEDDLRAELIETANIRSIVDIEENAETLKLRLSFFQPQPVNIASANPNQFVSAPMRNLRAEASIATNYRDEKATLAARRSFVYSYVLSKHFELRISSAAEDVFEAYRRRIDGFLGVLIPSELRRLDSIRDNLDSSNPEDWANAVHSCRRLLQAVADALYPPAEGTVKAGSGRAVKVGKDQYINRLVLFCESTVKSVVSSKVLCSDLQYIGERLDAVFSAVQKGSHAEIEVSEAQRFVIHTYLLVGDILDLNAEQSASPSGLEPPPLGEREIDEVLGMTAQKI
ncbi:hypothetical protein GVY41_09000 [Frigidibacter albus]|uniref:AbiTii domain-containing protein n=1 Tax=Frigidibacter albus TaxID=1465486 RepID=A0A6L8VI72_9RHOB|nr:hypothetical protein [Frigidibacter albus]MZQ89232.1 hypothetical protein [Frigidibacter albus]NBE31138.1 hypothetical protein [Frigidibacter albus]GGH53071.1 hypothetical protein GCM10011341_18190 [Frigidibacter albus]